MGLLDGIEKLINEHGSSVILKERIQLANDRYQALEERCERAEQERVALEGRVSALLAEVNAAKSEVEALQAALISARAEVDEVRRLQEEADRERQQKLAGADRMQPQRETVLKVVCIHSDFEAKHIADIVGASLQITQWHLDALSGAKLISPSYQLGFGGSKGITFWNVTSSGRDYLATHGLLGD